MESEIRSSFGGHWSDEKLKALQAYMQSYCSALKNSPFELVYIDAFAGGGKTEVEPNEAVDSDSLFSVEDEQEVARYRHGSPLLALGCSPPFSKFIFIERDEKNIRELQRQVEASGLLNSRSASFRHGDANEVLQQITARDWRKHRAVAFLDPFALQVTWNTIKAIAMTQAIDMWLLFPAMAVNRMLPRSGVVPESWAEKLNTTFGSDSWRDEFYRQGESDLFGESALTKAQGIFTKLSDYVTGRLSSVFAGVHEKPLILRNSSGAPIFLLCFACGNPNGASIAKRIAQHIINKQSHGR